jgi:hypothetical protein
MIPVLPAVVVVATALLVGACSSDDGDDRAAPTVTSTTGAKPTSATTAALQCEKIGFTANSDDVATEITATGIDCQEAGQLIRAVHTGQNPVSGSPTLDIDGFRCTVAEQPDDPLPATTFDCRRGDERVTWKKT